MKPSRCLLAADGTIHAICQSIGPSAIARFVVAVVVYAIYLKPIGARPHMFKEGGEVVTPFIAHSNSAAAISAIARILRIETTLFRAMPSAIFLGMSHPMNHCCAVNLQTAAASNSATGEMPSEDNVWFAAITNAIPHGPPILGPTMKTDYGESPKSLAREVPKIVGMSAISPAAATLNFAVDQGKASSALKLSTVTSAFPFALIKTQRGQLAELLSGHVFNILRVFGNLIFSHCVSYLRTMSVVRAVYGASHTVAARLVYTT